VLTNAVNAMMTNIENNGAPWQYNQQDRLNWKTKLKVNKNALKNWLRNVLPKDRLKNRLI
jgi:hypothetical protein